MVSEGLEGFGDLSEAEREKLFRQTAAPEAEPMGMARHGEDKREAVSGASLAGLAASVDAAFGDVIDTCIVDGQRGSGARAVQDPKRELHRRYGATSECLYLIRPDGYVGYRSQPESLPLLRNHPDRIFLPKASA